MYKPGDVIAFYSDKAGKRKYHVCIDLDGKYLFLNSPKKRVYPTDFTFPCDEMDFVPPTESGDSIISCSLPMHITPAELRRLKAKRLGELPRGLFLRLIKYIEDNPVLSDEEKEVLISGMADWF